MEYFVDDQYLKTYTNITSNVGEQDLHRWTKTASELYIRNIMGYNFFNDILDKDNSNTLNADELKLVDDFIRPAVAHRTSVSVTKFLTFRLSDKGVQSQSGEYSMNVDVSQVDYIIKEITSICKQYERDLVAYLTLNTEKFPLWESNENKDIVRPTTYLNNGGITSI